MHHSQEQLDALWAAVRSNDAAARELLAHYTNPHMPGVLPAALYEDADAHILLVPAADALRKHVYARRPGGAWTELKNSA